MPRISVRLLLLLLFLAAVTALLVNTQSLSATPTANAAADKDKDRDKDKNKDRDDRGGNVVIAQLSDIHMGLDKAPDAARNLQRALEMIADHHVDAIVVSGDIGERPPEREQVKQMIDRAARGVPVYYVPGNHDDTARDTDQYTSIFGRNYYEANIKGVTLVVLDSQLLGNYDNFGAREAQPLAPEGQEKAQSMLGWLQNDAAREARGNGEREARGGGEREGRGVVIAVQHVPLDRGPGFPMENDPKPYWTSQEPYRSRVADMLHRMGVHDLLAGHLHHQAIYKASGFTIHVAPAIGYPIGGGDVGFAVHTITRDGDVKTEFVSLH
jgi:3',5'-cyclic AMP phosphodiesterase CpdA